MIKAWACSYDSDERYTQIYWAETAGKAKYQATLDDDMDYPEFTDIECRRAKWADGLDKLPDTQMEIEKIKHGWVYTGPSGELVDKDALPLITKYSGTLDSFFGALDSDKTPLYYSFEDGIFKEVSHG